jgi:phage gp36-like protein
MAGVLTPTPYAVLADVYNLGVPQAAVATVSTPQQQEALDAANAEADMYFRAVFQLPLTSWDRIVQKMVCARAAWTILTVRGYSPDDGADKNIQDAAKEALEQLQGIADGKWRPNVVDSTAGMSGDTGSRFANQATIAPAVPPSSNTTLSLGYGAPSVTQTPSGILTVGSPNLRGY